MGVVEKYKDLFITIPWGLFALVWLIVAVGNTRAAGIGLRILISILAIAKSAIGFVLPDFQWFGDSDMTYVVLVLALFDPLFNALQLLIACGYGTTRYHVTYLEITLFGLFLVGLFLPFQEPFYGLIGVVVLVLVVREWCVTDSYLQQCAQSVSLQSPAIAHKKRLFSYMKWLFLLSFLCAFAFATLLYISQFRENTWISLLFILKEIALMSELMVLYRLLSLETLNFPVDNPLLLRQPLIVTEISAPEPYYEPPQSYFRRDTSPD